MSIAPPSMATGVQIGESEMSSKGQAFVAADHGRIENKGQQFLQITTNEGRRGMTRYQIGDVNRPLMAVSQTCDAGNHVLFLPRTEDGFTIWPMEAQPDSSATTMSMSLACGVHRTMPMGSLQRQVAARTISHTPPIRRLRT